jgi:membrane dipeptidase
MVEAGQMRPIRTARELTEHVALWNSLDDRLLDDAPIGFVLSLEGADSLLTLDHLHRAWEQGLRAVGPAHYGPGRYAPGTGGSGELTPLGRELLPEMERLGMCLDATHLTDEAFWQALDLFGGVVWASHQNCRSLVPHERQFSDDQLRAVIERGGVIGTACDAWMLYPAGWTRFQTTPQESGVRMQTLADHLDHVCQLAGNARHAAIGSDLDGGYGTEQTPLDLKTIADLQYLQEILSNRGYSERDIRGIMHGNWIRVLSEALPPS